MSAVSDDAPRQPPRISRWVSAQLSKEAFSDVAHVAFLLALLVVVRPMFTSVVPAQTYEETSVVRGLLELDFDILIRGARRRSPGVPRVLFLVLPTLAFVFARRKLRWTDWEHGRALRVCVMAVVVMLAWSGSTFDYNIYLNQGHFFDRLLLVALAALSWRTPLAVPFATRLAIIMIKEAYHPIPQDDFDYRPTAELLVVFSVFAWASLKRSFKPKHFLVVALGAWCSYYFVAGTAKMAYGVDGSWLLHNHVTNLGMGGHIRGWLGFLDEGVTVPFYDFVKRFDRALAYYVVGFELSALAACFIHPKLTRLWLALGLLFHVALFLLSGVCFWKWGVVCAVLFVWLGRGGAPVLADMCRHKLVLVLGIVSVYYSGNRIWYYPQTGVAWYDTTFVVNYLTYAVGRSGKRYLVDPNYFAPMDMHFVQGRMCYVGGDRSITGIYGTTGSLSLTNRLERAESPDVALKLWQRGRRCKGGKHERRKRRYSKLMKRFFGNINRYGRPHNWLRWIGRPTHLHVHQQGEQYDLQEPVRAVELWHEPVFWHAGKLHRWPKKRVDVIAIP